VSSDATYKAIEVTKPGIFTEVDRPLREPGSNEVRVRVEACGVCRTDSALMNEELPGLSYPRVPGHEVIGRIDAVGSNVRTRSVGQRVGIGSVADGTTLASRASEETLSTARMRS
jgi:alcohol dehydrogenase, propanol-preferring